MKKNITDYLDKMNGTDNSQDNEWNYNRSLIEASLDAFITLDLDGLIKNVNYAAEEITGIARNILVESEFALYFSEPLLARNAYKLALAEGKVYNFELNIKHVEGYLTPILLNASTLKNSESAVIGVLCTLRDITSTKKIEDELMRLKDSLDAFVIKRASELTTANMELAQQTEEKNIKEMQTNILKEQNLVLEMQKQQLDEASHLKSSFLSNMSHELRTPLNAIVGFTDLALKTSLNSRQRNYLSKIKLLSHTLLGLISDILDLSKIEAGKLELEMAIFELEEVIQNAVNQVSTKSQEKGLTLTYTIDEDVPQLLRGDSLRLGQILINLASNAVKFTKKGSVDIQVKQLDNNGTEVVIQFSVKDTGIGMTEQQMKKLFQPFSQADTSTTRKYGGTGLGLSISQELISKMQGKIWVTSVPDKGSTFYFTIKIDVADTLHSKHFKNKFDKWGLKALVVDDQAKDREIVGNMLQEMTIDVTLCGSGKEALSILDCDKENPTFDLVIIDWKMDEMDGIETAKHIKQLFAFRKEPKLMMITSHLNQGVQEKADEIGLHEGVLYKPITPSLLFNSIIQVCFKDDFDKSSDDIEKKHVTVTAPHLRGTKVLLVEDNEINREVAQEILQEAGLEVTLANNGQEALDIIHTQPFEVVLMDIQMPIMDGYAATRAIRKNPQFADLPIIAMTANALISDQLDCFNAGMNDHISKPIDIDRLFHTIALWIHKKKEDVIGNAQIKGSADSSHTTKEYKGKDTPGMHSKSIDAQDSDSRGADLPVMDSPGIDYKTGLTRFGGNEKLYLKLLIKFQKNQKHVIEEINFALTHNDLEAASKLVHALKGVAGNLSIQDVFLDSDTLETTLKVKKLHIVDLLLEKLEKSLLQSFATITTLNDTMIIRQDLEKIEQEPFKLLEYFDKLETLMDDSDVEALEYMEEISKHTTGFAFHDTVEGLKEIIDQYDYDRARPIFNALNLLIRKEINYERQ